MLNDKNVIPSLPALITRLTVGFVFAFGAWSKFQNIDEVIAQFSQTGFPFVAPLTYLVCTIELLAGVLLMIGLFTRIIVVPLIIIEAIAAFTVKAHLMTNLAAALNFTEFLYIWLFLWILVYGPGRFSVDHWRKSSRALLSK